MSVADCARLVAARDPHRFRAAMAAPVAARQVLLPVYALASEIARAPWVTAEPLIARMRLEWWREALDEIAAQGPVRAHEVATPLAEALEPKAVRVLAAAVEARQADIARAPFADAAAARAYAHATAGPIAHAAALALGAGEAAAALAGRAAGAAGFARLLCAAPRLRAAGWPALDRIAVEALGAAAADEGAVLADALASRGSLPRAARAALFETADAARILARAAADPARIPPGLAAPGRLLAPLRMALHARRMQARPRGGEQQAAGGAAN